MVELGRNLKKFTQYKEEDIFQTAGSLENKKKD